MKSVFPSVVIAACLALLGCSGAPTVFKVNLDTTKGPVVIEVHRDWAPLGADRFHELVKSGYYDGARFFRVLPGFMAQFGIAADPQVTAKWKNENLQDDPVKQSNLKGMVTFATAGPNTRTTQMFINTADNVNLDGMGFAPIGKVIAGLDVVQNFYSGYGEGAPQGRGPYQGQLELLGNPYLEKNFPQLDFIRKATIQ